MSLPLCLVVMLLVVSALVRPVAPCACNTTDVWNALASLYHSTNGVQWTNQGNWLEAGSTVCDWYGVSQTCTVLELSRNNLRGTLPPELSLLAPMLGTLDLSGNLIVGTLPPSYSAMSKLSAIVLSYNNISGTLPPEYADLHALKHVNISHNNISGTLPREYGVGWPHVEAWFINRNRLNGTIPPEYGKMHKMKEINWNDNFLSGSIPKELSQWSRIWQFFITNNRLNGTLPPELAEWGKSVTEIRINHNKLSGTLPREYSRLSLLAKWVVDVNQFSGSLPPEYATWRSLLAFVVRDNLFTGTIPKEYAAWGNISHVDVSANRLTGTLPVEFANWTRVVKIEVFGNQLEGTLPWQWMSMTEMLTFVVVGNRLHGTMPLEYAAWTFIGVFAVSYNRLSGTLPQRYVTSWPLIRVLAMEGNDISGSLPSGPWASSLLSVLLMHQNPKLSGTLPSQMPAVALAATCNTSLCGATPFFWFGTKFTCQNTLPFIGILLNSDLIILTLIDFSENSLKTCGTPTSPAPRGVRSNTTRQRRLSSSSLAMGTVSVVSGVAVGVSVSSVGGAPSLQSVAFLQVTMTAVRLASRVAACLDKNAADVSQNTPPSSGEVGEEVGDNPTRIKLPGLLAYPGGTIVGNNLLLLAVPGAAAAGVSLWRRLRPTESAGSGSPLQASVGAFLGVWSFVQVPNTMAALSLLFSAAADGGSVTALAIVGVVALTLTVMPTAALLWCVVRSRAQFDGERLRTARRSTKVKGRRGVSAATQLLVSLWSTLRQPRSRWRPLSVGSRRVSLSLCTAAMLLESCLAPHWWIAIVDVLMGELFGVLGGVASAPGVPCAVLTVMCWLVFAVAAGCAVLACALLPRPTIAEVVFQADMALGTAAASLCSALGKEEPASIFGIVMCAVQLLWSVPHVGLRLYRIVVPSSAALSAVPVNSNTASGGGRFSVPPGRKGAARPRATEEAAPALLSYLSAKHAMATKQAPSGDRALAGLVQMICLKRHEDI